MVQAPVFSRAPFPSIAASMLQPAESIPAGFIWGCKRGCHRRRSALALGRRWIVFGGCGGAEGETRIYTGHGQQLVSSLYMLIHSILSIV